MLISSTELVAGTPSCCFASFERDSYMLTDNRMMAVLALCHAFWQHATITTLGYLIEYVVGSGYK